MTPHYLNAPIANVVMLDTDLFEPRLHCPSCGPTNRVAEFRGFMFCIPCCPAIMRAVENERLRPTT